MPRFTNTILWCLLFADDITLIADSKKHLQRLVNIVVERLRAGGLVVSAAKSKTMVLGESLSEDAQQQPVTLGEQGGPMEQVTKFKYLGSLIKSDGSDHHQVVKCMGKSWGLFWKSSHVLLRKCRLPAKLRGQFFSIYVRSAAFWDSHHWRMTPSMRSHINKNMHNQLTQMQGRGKHKNSDDPFNRLPHADMRNTLGLANPLAHIDLQEIRFFGSLLRDHRHRPTPVTVILAKAP